MADELSNIWNNLSSMVKEGKMIAIGNVFCSRAGKEKQLLSSWKSFDRSDSE